MGMSRFVKNSLVYFGCFLCIEAAYGLIDSNPLRTICVYAVLVFISCYFTMAAIDDFSKRK